MEELEEQTSNPEELCDEKEEDHADLSPNSKPDITVIMRRDYYDN